MTESDARAVLLVRAFELASPPAPGWTAADAAAADEAGRREVGASATPESWIVARARLASARLAERDAQAAAALRGTGWPGWLWPALVALAFALGIATDVLGGAHRINLLAPPLLAVVAWNLAVYVVLLGHALPRRPRSAAPGPLRGLLAEWLARGAAHAGATAGPSAAALGAFVRSWTGHAQPLYRARVALVLHASAAALVAGALLSLYGRGLVLEYRAGWDSTFLAPADVRAVLATVLAPASWLSGIALPDTARVAAMRFSAGAGENAAPWIHLYAITLALVVLVPRGVLAVAAAIRAAGLSARFALALDDPYFGRFHGGASGQAVAVLVLPYSYHVAPGQHPSLQKTLEQHVAARVAMQVADTLPLGAEDDLARWVGAQASPGTIAALFPLAATPEQETHGALVSALVACAGGGRVLVLVDESSFRRRFEGATLAVRLRERQQAWRALLQDAGIEPLFVDLAGNAPA